MRKSSLNILAISNYYPPYYIGGYEVGCRRVMEELKRRGHHVVVVTSDFGVEGSVVRGSVHRQLELHTPPAKSTGLWQDARIEAHNRRVLQRLLARYQPDVVNVWNMGKLSNSILATLQQRNLPTVYAISDYWGIKWNNYWNNWIEFWHWTAPNTLKGRVKRWLKSAASFWLPTEKAVWSASQLFFTSKALRHAYEEAGLTVEESPVIYWGIPIEPLDEEERPYEEQPSAVKVLFSGRLCEGKGVHTLLEALPLLQRASIHCSIVGDADDPAYYERLRRLATVGTSFSVTFHGKIPPEAMPKIYRQHDVLVFPSVWGEPFALTILEAMAAGMCVVGTMRGGSAEILSDEVNSLTFKADDPRDLANKLQRAIDDTVLRIRLSQAGQELVRQRFALSHMVDELETLFHEAVGHGYNRPNILRS